MAKNPAQRGRGAFIASFLAPAILLYGVFVLLPLIQAFQLSMYRWRGVSARKQFVGAGNFEWLIKEDAFWKSLKNNLWLIVVCGVVTIALAILIAHGMQGKSRLGKALRSVYLFPHIISMVVVAILWMFLYNPSYGPVTEILKAVGLKDIASKILGSPDTALPAVAIAFIWYALGFYIMLFSAGLQNIPGDVVEAAELDGSTGLHRFKNVTWPMLWSIKRVAVIYIVINVMNLFALVYILTDGGPDRASEVLLTYLYKTGFKEYQFGQATAIAVANFVVAMALAAVLMLIFRRDPTEARKAR